MTDDLHTRLKLSEFSTITHVDFKGLPTIEEQWRRKPASSPKPSVNFRRDDSRQARP